MTKKKFKESREIYLKSKFLMRRHQMRMDDYIQSNKRVGKKYDTYLHDTDLLDKISDNGWKVMFNNDRYDVNTIRDLCSVPPSFLIKEGLPKKDYDTLCKFFEDLDIVWGY